jgi:hypothetical protein
MANLAQLTTWRDVLMAARYRGIRTVEIEGRRVTYATDAEMAAALADLERKITATGPARVSVVQIASSKGV